MEGILVNGPINAARLEGNVFGVHKVIYLFMDIHSEISTQTQCSSFYSIDLAHYIAKTFSTADKNKTFDVFTELSGTAIASPDSPYRGRYVDEINRYLKSQYTKTNSNIRVHYIDIRDILKANINMTIYNIYNIIRGASASKYLSKLDYDNLSSYITYLKSHVNDIYAMMYKDHIQSQSRLYPKNNKLITPNTAFSTETAQKFITKITSKYNHNELRNKLSYVLEAIKTKFGMILDLIDQMLNLMQQSRDFLLMPPNKLSLQDYTVIKTYAYGRDPIKFLDFICNAELLINKIDILCVYNFAELVDLFFLRRFLDKDYVTNAIVYTGAAHSIFYIYYLVNQFDFKITNLSYHSEIKNLSDIEKIIRDSEYNPSIQKIFMPATFSQCINLTEFPKGFD